MKVNLFDFLDCTLRMAESTGVLMVSIDGSIDRELLADVYGNDSFGSNL
jgi:hypothetical protein